MYILLAFTFSCIVACVVALCLKKWKMAGGIAVIMLLTNSLPETFPIVPLTFFQSLQNGTILKVECYNIHSGGEDFEGRSDDIYKQICETDSSRFYTGIELGYVVRDLEADIIYKCLQVEKHSTIMMADMNDIGGSYAMRRIKRAGMTDAWWKGGFGYRYTFHKHVFRFRLDSSMMMIVCGSVT